MENENLQASYIRVLSNRSLFSLWLGQSVSQSGDSIFDLAILWLVIVSTGSAFFVGIISGIIYLTQILFGLIGGVYVDRFNRKTMLVSLNILQGVVTGIISLLYVRTSLNFSSLVGATFVIYGLAVLIRALVNSMIPLIVDRADLAASNGLFSLTSSFNTFLNYTIGGLVVAALGIALPITYDSLTFFFAAVMAMFIARKYGAITKPNPNQPPQNFHREWGEGFRYIRSSRFLLQVLLFGSVVNFFGTGAITLLSPYSKLWIQGGADTYGFILAAFSLGGIAASAVFGKLNLRRHVGRILLLGITVVGASILLMGLVRKPVLAVPFSFMFGFSVVFANLPIQVLLQAKTPSKLFGRMYTALTTAVSVAQPISAVIAGSLATLISVGLVFVIFGVCIMAFSSLAYIALAELKNSAY